MANDTMVFSHTVEIDAVKKFDAKYLELKKYADRKRLKKPKKGDVLAKVMKAGVKEISIESYFGE